MHNRDQSIFASLQDYNFVQISEYRTLNRLGCFFRIAKSLYRIIVKSKKPVATF